MMFTSYNNIPLGYNLQLIKSDCYTRKFCSKIMHLFIVI